MKDSVGGSFKQDNSAEPTLAKVRVAALNLLARREHTQLELQQKLELRFPQSLFISSVLEKLIEQNLLSDLRFAEGFIRMRKRQGKGPKQIAQELKIRGLDANLYEEFLCAAEVDWSLNAEQVYLKKYGAEPVLSLEEKMKRQRFLMSRGFSSDHIRPLSNKYFKV